MSSHGAISGKVFQVSFSAIDTRYVVCVTMKRNSFVPLSAVDFFGEVNRRVRDVI